VFAEQPEILILENGLYPNAMMSKNGDITICAINWKVPYSASVQKVDSKGNKLWHGTSEGLFITQPVYPPEYAFLETPVILHSSDGGLFFIYNYAYWIEGTHGPMLFKTWPAVQKMDRHGDVLWGRTGIQLSHREIHAQGGSTILDASFTPDGDILVLWSWFDHTNQPHHQEFATDGQKIDPETGELLWGEDGRRYLHSSSQKALTSRDQIYVFHGDSVLCLDRHGMWLWDLELPTDFGKNRDTICSANDSGDVCMVYSVFSVSSRDYEVKTLIFNKEGEYSCENKTLFSGSRILGHHPIVPLGKDKWLFQSDGIRCLNKNGDLVWGDRAVQGSGKIQSIATMDTNIFYFLTGTQKLCLYRSDREGNLLWNDSGIEIATDVIDEHNTILVDSYQNAYIVFHTFASYEPEFRPRGTYIQKVNKSGEIGFVSSVDRPPDQVKSSLPVLQTRSYPNPFQSDMNIRINDIIPSIYPNVEMVIYNIMGREVLRCTAIPSTSGQHEFSWNGRDRTGREVSPGIYVYHIVSGFRCLTSGKIVKGGY